MNFLRPFQTWLPQEDKPHDKTVSEAAKAPIGALGKGVCAMLDNWFHLHPNAPLVRSVKISTTPNGTFVDFHEDLAPDLPNEIRSECSKQVMDIVTASNDLRDAMPQCAMPFIALFHTEAYCGSKGMFHKIDYMDATVAGLSFSASMLTKLVLIDESVERAKTSLWDVIDAKNGGLTHTLHANGEGEASLKAAATILPTGEMRDLVRNGTVAPWREERMSELHVSRRAQSLTKSLGVKVLEDAVPA